MSETTHQGWANYPTWAAHMWLANDEGTYCEINDGCRETRDEWMEYHADPDKPLTREQIEALTRHMIDACASHIEHLVEIDAPVLFVGLHADLMTWAVQCIDTREIAMEWVNELVSEVAG